MAELQTEEQIRAATVGELKPLAGKIVLRDSDPLWPQQYLEEERALRNVLGERARLIEHVGSTSVPGLPAKPIIDMVLVVESSADEPAYVPALEEAGYILRIREPHWFQHRMFKGPRVDINLHVFSAECPEVERMLTFRNWLRRNEADRNLYADAKRRLAEQTWTYMQNYADSKSSVIQEIMDRTRQTALSGSEPQPLSDT
jgi:GrpB-like predicted nucleotidyltransferase (UPF0157 family)